MPGARRKSLKPKQVKTGDNYISKRITRSQTEKMPGCRDLNSQGHNAGNNISVPSNTSGSLDINVNFGSDTHLNNQSHATDVGSFPSFKTPDIEDANTLTDTLTDTNLYCYPACKLGRGFSKDMLQCSMCMLFYHSGCTDSFATQFSWICNTCRSLPQMVFSMKEQLSELHETLTSILNQQNEFYNNMCSINIENSKLKLENKNLKKEIYDYRMKAYRRFSSSTSDDTSSDSGEEFVPVAPSVKNRKKKLNSSIRSGSYPVTKSIFEDQDSIDLPSSCKKPTVTVVGNSMVRETGKTLSTNLINYDSCVLSTSGYTVHNAISNIEKLTKQHKDDIMVFNLGTAEVEHLSAGQIANRYDQLLKKTKRSYPENVIIVTAVPPRISSGSNVINKRTAQLNQLLLSICENYDNCVFLDCNPEAIPKNYKYDGLHFSVSGKTHFALELSNFINTNFHMKNVLQLD